MLVNSFDKGLALEKKNIAILIPCLNEGLIIGKVVSDFKSVIPEAKIYVYDNRSTDNTAEEAKAAGAIVRYEPRRGKGNVIRRMFADIEADIYVMVDGDNTYEVGIIPKLINKLVAENLDMVVGTRTIKKNDNYKYRPGHQIGNLLLTNLVSWLFGTKLTDMLSGYRVFSRRFVKSFPVLSSGFEIETELTIHALELNVPFSEESTLYIERISGSESKLKTYRDGWRVLGTAIILFKEIKPFLFFAIISFIFAILSIVLFVPILVTFFASGLVPKFPTLIIAAAIMLLAFLSLTCGVVLDSVSRGRKEIKRMIYLNYLSPQNGK